MQTPQIEVSTCCKAKPLEDFKENHRDHHDPHPIYRCEKCKLECDVEDVCEFCLGKGEYAVEGKVYAGEPHTALIDIQKCECQLSEKDPDEDYENSRDGQ